MYKGFKIIDADSHMMEPDEIWDKYLEPKYRPWAPGGSKSSRNGLRNLNKVGFTSGATGEQQPFINDGEGGILTYAEAYRPYLEREFDPQAFLMYMDMVGIDYMVLYPTAALGLTAGETGSGRQLQNPKVAAALYRAYNNWVYDFCDQGQGRLFGTGGVDLRDADAAAMEARRCVKELGMKALYILPQPALGIPLHDEYYDVLWAEIADLGVPMGVHGLRGSSHIGKDYWADTFNLGRAASSFPMEEMLAFVSLAGGGALDRNPEMKILFLESSAGWAPFWLWWCDDKWNEMARNGERDTEHPPSFYFKRQCWISGEPDEPGLRWCIEQGLENNVVTATDFPHPEDVNFPRVLDDFFEIQPKVMSQEQMGKILWDNPARLYNIS